MMIVDSGASNTTHVYVTGARGALTLAWCSEVEPWEPETGYGWCPHDREADPVGVEWGWWQRAWLA